ncbi:MAG TPA: hypothetical protein VMJ70_09320 [Candidatus Sulfotelmatobacter sp.]|nr:hypothetical protein [Candidatus Sulfotelmatobacter sp.]
MDSITAWAVRARSMFRTNTGDSLGGTNYVAYEFVGKIGRTLLRSLGRGNFAQAFAVEPVIDSLGLDTTISTDPEMPYFAVLMVRNPFRSTADVTGFLYWYQGQDLRIQGVRFTSGRNVFMRVWRTGYETKPYSWAIMENARHGSGPLLLTLLRLSQNGYFWMADQYPGHGPDMGGPGDFAFADINDDGIPELVTWTIGVQDSLFITCEGCPKLVTERTWTERDRGFEISEDRLVPSPYSTFLLFTRLLREGNRTAASRLLINPTRVNEAITNGWDKGGPRGIYQVVNVEPGQTWPHWMVIRRGTGKDAPSWAVHFVVKDGRWIISDWIREKVATSSQVQVR